MNIDDQSESDTELNRIFGSLGFGIAVWNAFIFTYGGRACSPAFSWLAGFSYVVEWTLVGFIVWIPAVIVVAALSCLVMAKTALSGRPLLTNLVGIAIVVAAFAVMFAATTPNRGTCNVFPDF